MIIRKKFPHIARLTFKQISMHKRISVNGGTGNLRITTIIKSDRSKNILKKYNKMLKEPELVDLKFYSAVLLKKF